MLDQRRTVIRVQKMAGLPKEGERPKSKYKRRREKGESIDSGEMQKHRSSQKIAKITEREEEWETGTEARSGLTSFCGPSIHKKRQMVSVFL